MKTCFKCKRELEPTEFYRHPMMGDGLLGKCKDCTKTDVKNRYRERLATDPTYIEKERARGREKYARLYAVGSNWQTPEAPESVKYHARSIVAAAIRKGQVGRPSQCSECGVFGMIQAHHLDYYKPFDVLWLCSTCHRRHHATAPERVKESIGRTA
jgi:hypothetical protein